MADDEEVDPKKMVDDKCAKTIACAKLYVAYETCAERIEKKGHGECGPFYMDWLGCIDRCVSAPPGLPTASAPGSSRAACYTPLQAKDEIFAKTK